MRMDAYHSWGNGTGFTYFLRSPASWWSRNPSAHCCQLQCGPLLLRELRLGHCSFAHRLYSEMITGNRCICSRVRCSLRLASVLFSFMLNSGIAVANVFRCEQRTRVHVTRNTANIPTISHPLFDLLFPRFSPELKGEFGFNRLNTSWKEKICFIRGGVSIFSLFLSLTKQLQFLSKAHLF